MQLGDDDIEHLQNIVFGGLMRKVTPPEIEAKLLKTGHIRRAVGGLVPTNAAYQAVTKDSK